MKKYQHFTFVSLLGFVLFICGCKKDNSATPANSTKVTPSQFTVASWSYSSPSYYAKLDVPEITSSNINTSAVMVYFNKGSEWVALPFTQYYSPYNYFMGFRVGVGYVEITWIYDTSTSAGNDPNAFYGTSSQFKVVVISEAARKANPDLDLNNYNAVKQRLGFQN